MMTRRFTEATCGSLQSSTVASGTRRQRETRCSHHASYCASGSGEAYRALGAEGRARFGRQHGTKMSARAPAMASKAAMARRESSPQRCMPSR
eukprot:scaffold43453_cov75-Phaeocystis_antarctica.AAC.4